ncbi:SRPBCC family protein [Mucilaginibacter lutimaris]|uniref:SRPBCC family protein n=1 Tax=Mucilaginibacter lutimaris TaxID=931629 RepID=A0ABW2ZFJ1_9SPHI
MTTVALQNRYRGPAESQEPSLNLSTAERTISIATGIKLALSGFKGLFKSPFSSIIKLGAGGYLLNRGLTGHCDLYARMGRNSTEPVNVNIRSSYHIDKPRQEVYDFWRKLDNLPLFMKHLESVEVIDDKRSHWVLKLPMGAAKVSWDAEIVKDEPGYSIGWSSMPDSLIDNAGKVRFQDSIDGNGTLVDVVISYRPPAGGFGGGIAHILNPVFKNMVDNDVRNFKQYMDIDGGIASDTAPQANDNEFAEPVAVVIEETIIEESAPEEINQDDNTNRFRSHIEPVDGRQTPRADSSVM